MKKEFNKVDWLDFTRSFLDLVELACKESRDPKHNKKRGGQTYEYGATVKIAIIYNLKHAIEIFIKTLIRIIDDHSEETIGGKNGHDLEYLFGILEEKMKNGNIKKVIENNKEDDPLVNFSKQEIQEFDQHAKEIKKIIDYYHGLEFLDKSKIKIMDRKNTAFKYPESETEIHAKIDYYNIAYRKSIDIEKTMKDITTLENYLRKLQMIFETYHKYKL